MLNAFPWSLGRSQACFNGFSMSKNYIITPLNLPPKLLKVENMDHHEDLNDSIPDMFTVNIYIIS